MIYKSSITFFDVLFFFRNLQFLDEVPPPFILYEGTDEACLNFDAS